ncbi:MAG TPA: hypothetical protein VM324_14060 [Egibacteraceae bacterium]|jgi:hypothetical protein|nr:hypothetical protein [Egibacteraceae bacterium]
METVRPRELHVAARVADALVYAVGAAGVLAGGLLFRDGSIGFAIVAWGLTFVGGAGLRLAAWSARALAELLMRSARMESDLAALLRDRAGSPPPPTARRGGPDASPDPYRRWGGHH